MKHSKRWLSWALTLVMLVSMAILPGAGCAETDSDSDAVYFDPTLIQLLDISARDFMKTEDMRALFAFILGFEFNQQDSGYEFDFSKKIYVAENDLDLATAALGVEGGYVCIFYSNLTDPVTTAYSILEDTSSFVMKLALEGNNETVWEVSLEDFTEQGNALAEALGT